MAEYLPKWGFCSFLNGIFSRVTQRIMSFLINPESNDSAILLYSRWCTGLCKLKEEFMALYLLSSLRGPLRFSLYSLVCTFQKCSRACWLPFVTFKERVRVGAVAWQVRHKKCMPSIACIDPFLMYLPARGTTKCHHQAVLWTLCTGFV
jgi:hypothetical protein